MHRTVTDTTILDFHCLSHQAPGAHLEAFIEPFVNAYNCAKQPKGLPSRTPHQALLLSVELGS